MEKETLRKLFKISSETTLQEIQSLPKTSELTLDTNGTATFVNNTGTATGTNDNPLKKRGFFSEQDTYSCTSEEQTFPAPENLGRAIQALEELRAGGSTEGKITLKTRHEDSTSVIESQDDKSMQICSQESLGTVGSIGFVTNWQCAGALLDIDKSSPLLFRSQKHPGFNNALMDAENVSVSDAKSKKTVRRDPNTELNAAFSHLKLG